LEINKIGKEIIGVVPTADVVEGRFGLLVTHTWSADFGSKEDLPGWKVPATAEEAKRARFCITWAVDNRPFPLFQPVPAVAWSLRSGAWDQAQTHPFSATMYLSDPAHKNDMTIPSGVPSLAFARGTYTFTTSDYIANASLVAGAMVIVANTNEDTTDAGKLKYQSTYDDRVVGVVRERDATTDYITVDTGSY
jgi:hypothetical protein